MSDFYDRLCGILDAAKVEGDQDTDAYASAILELFTADVPEGRFPVQPTNRISDWRDLGFALDLVLYGYGHTRSEAWTDATTKASALKGFELCHPRQARREPAACPAVVVQIAVASSADLALNRQSCGKQQE